MAISYSGSRTTPRLDLGEAIREFMFTRSDFIGTELLPLFEVSEKKGVLPLLMKESLLRPGDVKRAPRAAYNRETIEATETSYTCVERGQEYQLDHSELAYYASDFDAELEASRQALWKVLQAQETDIASLLLNTTTFTTGNGRRTDVSTAWSTASATIVSDVLAAKESIRGRTGMDANVVAFGAAVLPSVLKNTDIADRLRYVQAATPEAIENALAAMFGVERVLIGKGVTNSADEGQAFSQSDIWGSGWAVVARCRTPGGPLNQPGLGMTPMWVSDAPEAVMVETYEEPQTRSTIVRARNHCDELVLDADFEQLLDIAG